MNSLLSKESLFSKTHLVGHKLYDSTGGLVSSVKEDGFKLRSKIRCVDWKGNVMNMQNTTIYPGRRFMLELLTRQKPKVSQQLTLNTLLNINPGVTVPDSKLLERMICLVGVGRGGATMQFADVLDSRAHDLNLFDQIPFRCVPVDNDLPPEERAMYYMRVRKVIDSQTYYCYYLKKITASEIFVKHQDTNYTPQESDNDPELDPNDPLSLYPIQIFTTFAVDIGVKDLKEFYNAEDGNLRKGRFNEMSLYFGVPMSVTDGVTGEVYDDYCAVEAFSHLTFNSRPSDTTGSSYSFSYYLIS